jgi:hypothetical protein
MRGSALFALCLAGAVAACASNPAEVEEQSKLNRVKLSGGTIDIAKKEGKVDLAKDERVKCERYTPLGSHRTQLRCTTLTEAETAEEANKREMRKLTVPPPHATGTQSR